MIGLPPPLPETSTNLVTHYGSRLLVAALLAAGGYWLIKLAINAIGRLLTQRQVDRDVQPFVLSLLRIGLQVALLLSVFSTLGIETNSFVAVIGAAGLAVGLALQGSLANLAGGLLILAFKPFRVGDLIAVQTFTGYVEAVYLFNTVLVTDDQRTVILPNNILTTNPITNFSRLAVVRVESVFVVSNQHPVDVVRASILTALATCPQLLTDRPPDVLVNKLTDNGIQFEVRVWIPVSAIATVNYAVQEAVARQFAQDQISSPRNEIDVLRFRSE